MRKSRLNIHKPAPKGIRHTVAQKHRTRFIYDFFFLSLLLFSGIFVISGRVRFSRTVESYDGISFGYHVSPIDWKKTQVHKYHKTFSLDFNVFIRNYYNFFFFILVLSLAIIRIHFKNSTFVHNAFCRCTRTPRLSLRTMSWNRAIEFF